MPEVPMTVFDIITDHMRRMEEKMAERAQRSAKIEAILVAQAAKRSRARGEAPAENS
jgi:hypothetical protein